LSADPSIRDAMKSAGGALALPALFLCTSYRFNGNETAQKQNRIDLD